MSHYFNVAYALRRAWRTAAAVNAGAIEGQDAVKRMASLPRQNEDNIANDDENVGAKIFVYSGASVLYIIVVNRCQYEPLNLLKINFACSGRAFCDN